MMESLEQEEMLIDNIHFSALKINTVNEKKRSHSESSNADSSNEGTLQLRRSTRKRFRTQYAEVEVQVCTVACTNGSNGQISSGDMKATNKYSPDRKSKTITHTSLETIFEEPSDHLVMSKKKLRRYIKFSPQSDRGKVLKRRKKSKTLNSTFRKSAKKAATDLLLQSKLSEMEDL